MTFSSAPITGSKYRPRRCVCDAPPWEECECDQLPNATPRLQENQ